METMVFEQTGGGEFLKGGGFLVKNIGSPPMTMMPDGLAIPAGLYTLHNLINPSAPKKMPEGGGIIESSIYDELFKKLQETTTRQQTKRRKGNKRKRRTKKK